MRVTVVLQDKIIARAMKMFGKKTLTGLLNSCLADRIAQVSKKHLETRLGGEYRKSKTDRRRVSSDSAGINKEDRPSWWREEKEFIRKLIEKDTMKGKRKWKREDLHHRKSSA